MYDTFRPKLTLRIVKNLRDSQEERISILNMALIEKGIVFSSHYETTPQSLRSAGSNLNQPFMGPETREMTSSEETEENGVYL